MGGAVAVVASVDGQSVLRNAGGSIATNRSKLSTARQPPVKAKLHTPRFAIVSVKLGDDAEQTTDWLQQVRDICSLPVQGADTLIREPAHLASFLWLGDAGHAKD